MFHWEKKKRLGPLLIKLVSSVYFWHALCFCRKWLMPIEIAGKQNRENWVALMKKEEKEISTLFTKTDVTREPCVLNNPALLWC